MAFYHDVVNRLVAQGRMNPAGKTLVVCGGRLDREVLLAAGFTDVTISNLDDRLAASSFDPFSWSYQDAENLTYPDESFDYVVVNAGLHHCQSPHRGLLEMYRVARRGILVLEARDSLLMRLACKAGFSLEYELTAVIDEKWQTGGMRNGPVPNFVYRWTEREVFKTLATWFPEAPPDIHYFYDLQVWWKQVRMAGRLRYFLFRLAWPFAWLLTRVCRGQGNCFGFFARKPDIPADLHPWLTVQDGRVVMKRDGK